MTDLIIKQIKLDINKKTGYPIDNIADLKMLLESIDLLMPNSISFNTLRRFYGFMKGTAPQLNTLDVLCRFLGFKNYSDYLNFYSRDFSWMAWLDIIRMESKESISYEDLNWLKEHAQGDDEFYLKLSSVIRNQIYKKNYSGVNLIFNSDVFNLIETVRLKFSNHMAFIFRTMEKNEMTIWIKHLAPNIVFRENVLHWFVDYTHLNRYYGDFLKEAKKYCQPDSHENLFYDLMLNYNKFLSCKEELELISLCRVREDYFPVLISRCYGYNMLYFKQQGDNQQYEDTWEDSLKLAGKLNASHSMGIEIVPILMILKDFDKLTFFIQHYYEDLMSVVNYHQYHSVYMIILADVLMLLKNGKNAEAIREFELINILKINSSYYEYNMIFYYMVKYQLTKLTRVNYNLEIIEMEYNAIIAETGFSVFTSDFLKNYL